MVSTRGDSQSKYAPSNEKTNRGGTIKYLNDGISSVRQARREDAYQQMYTYCSGGYKIVSEGPNQEGGAGFDTGYGTSVWAASHYWYMTFECEQAAK